MADQVPELVGHGEALSGSGLVVVDMTFGVQVADLFPTRGDDGWVPASYVPGAQKAPAQVGAGASEGGAAVAAAGSAVPPVGLEPTTFGLKVRSSNRLS